LDEDSGWPRNHVLDRGADLPRGRGNFKGWSGPFKSIDNLLCSGRCIVAAKGIILLPLTSWGKKDHSLCQANANSIMKISGGRRCGYRPRETGGKIAQCGRSLIRTIALFSSSSDAVGSVVGVFNLFCIMFFDLLHS